MGGKFIVSQAMGGGIGDTLMLCALIGSYKKEKKIERVCLICKKRHAEVASAFAGVDEVIVSDRLSDALNHWSVFTRIRETDHYLNGNPALNYRWPNPCMLIGFKGITSADVIAKTVLGINSYIVEKPDFYKNDSSIPDVLERWRSLDKTVVLFPYAASIGLIDMEFWNTIAKHYTSKGYRVYTNVKGDGKEKPVSGTESFGVSLKELFVIYDNLGWEGISLRSGICDLLAYTDCKLHVIIPEADYDMLKMEATGLPNKSMSNFCYDLKKSGTVNADRFLRSIYECA